MKKNDTDPLLYFLFNPFLNYFLLTFPIRKRNIAEKATRQYEQSIEAGHEVRESNIGIQTHDEVRP